MRMIRDDIIWDYLRGLGGQVVRRRTYEEEVAVDKLHFNDMMGTVREESDPKYSGTEGAGTVNGYVITADGEPLDMEQPSDENHIQFHGGFLEDANFHTNPGTAGVMGYFYRMGIRHYSPSLGRFLQRDPFSYTRAPHKSNPVSLNPYSYANNRPTQLSDRSGYQACPGCTSPGGSWLVPGPHRPNGGGSGTDGSGGGNGGGETPSSPDKENKCLVYHPEECIDDENYPDNCSVLCCRREDTPYWWQGCCCGTCANVPLSNVCNTTDEGDCACACCLAEDQGSNSPAVSGGSSSHSSHFWKRPIFGPPGIGPFGNGGAPWSIMPTIPWWWLRPLYGVRVNSIFINGKISSNISIPYANIGLMIAWAPIIIGGIGALIWIWGESQKEVCIDVKDNAVKEYSESFNQGEIIEALYKCCIYYACCTYLQCVSARGVGLLKAYGGLIGIAIGIGKRFPWGAAIGTALTIAHWGTCLYQYVQDWLDCRRNY
jgi:RHS repeat-associated protein